MERPILFSTPMVRAILAGQKTMTRRAINPQPDEHRWRTLPGYALSARTYKTTEGLFARFQHYLNGVGEEPLWVRSPYGCVGDRLWVRETFASCGQNVWYRADCDDGPAHEVCVYQDGSYFEGKWKPSIFMPRLASRITLEITGVKVERLNQISNADIIREGIRSEACNVCVHTGGSGCDHCFMIIKPFRELWDAINGKTPGKSWDDNPYVWVVNFKRLEVQ